MNRHYWAASTPNRLVLLLLLLLLFCLSVVRLQTGQRKWSSRRSCRVRHQPWERLQTASSELDWRFEHGLGLREDLLTIVKRRKLQWYGHVSRSSGLAKTILQGTVKGVRRQGRQRKRLENNIRFFWSYFCLIRPSMYISLFWSLPQP